MDNHFRCYREKKFNNDQQEIINHANRFIETYQAQNLILTLRQLYYLFVTENLLPNKDTSYDRLGTIISDARMAGLVSWTSIEDRNRALKSYQTYKSPSEAIEQLKRQYIIDKWKRQQFRPEVWVEKAALEGVIAGICETLNVPYFSCRGYNSQSEQWRAGMRFTHYISQGQIPIIFHLGDHDPSGLNMTEDNRSRLSLFVGTPITVHRLALNIDQVEEYNLPPNPAKSTDSRFKEYRTRFGEESWELDALNPRILQKLVHQAIIQIRDDTIWNEDIRREEQHRALLDQAIMITSQSL